MTQPQLEQALAFQKRHGGMFSDNLVKLGFVEDEEITRLLSRQYQVPSIHLDRFEVDASVIELVPAQTAEKYQLLPLGRRGAILTLAMSDPTNLFVIDDIRFMTGYNVRPVVASARAIRDAIQKYYGSVHSAGTHEELG